MTPEAEKQFSEQRELCARRNAEHEPITWFSLTAADIADLASGYVSTSMRARCQFALDTEESDHHAAERPVRKRAASKKKP